MIIAILLGLVLAGVLAFRQANRQTWTVSFGVFLIVYSLFTDTGGFLVGAGWFAFIALAVILNIDTLRTSLVTDRLLDVFRKILPPMSQTEQEALAAGTVWWDAQLFSGNPQWNDLLEYPVAKLSDEEQAFVDGPVDELCAMLNDWKINQELNDLPPEVWQFIKDNKFFGMIIPKEYGGLEFSALAHSAVVMKISTRSVAAAVTVMVPNSLGPAELLLRYGTDEQKQHYLPRLAVGKDIPCFALTSPEAGSDASSIPDTGIVCRGEYNGKKDALGIRVTWDKRYITLGPVATVLGLAFKLYDPDHLLGEKEDMGITCALIPTDHPGVNIGRRHHPLGIAFQNGPNSGDDVFIPIEWVIGGHKQAGNGWRMLMECLAAGRSISLPALSVGGTKFSARAVGAYARVRKQFRTPIGYFEGIEEPLARIGGAAYMTDAARSLTACALDHGESPSVISAILKYNLTDRMRGAVNDAMDIQGGAGICLGENNIFGKLYQAIPISITVEGANILTRSMIVYGQGAIRCHPYVLKEMEAAHEDDLRKASEDFDEAICGHVSFTLANMSRSVFFGLTGSRLALVPMVGSLERYYQHLTRMSSAFAFVSDVAMLTLGGNLKRKEKISGRLADALSLLFLASATLKRYEDEGRCTEDMPFVQWALDDCLYKIQEALFGLFNNFPNKFVGMGTRLICFPLGRSFSPPSDEIGRKVSRALLQESPSRERLTAGIYISDSLDDQVGRLEQAFRDVPRIDEIEKRIFKARKDGILKINTMKYSEVVAQAVKANIISEREAEEILAYDEIRREIIRVDDFEPNEFKLKD